MVDEAMHSRFKVDQIYRREEIGEEAMKRITALASPSPVLAVVKKPSDIYVDDASELADIFSKGGLFLALDTIRDPGNLGTILRIADWFGIEAVFASKDTVDVFNPKVVQSTMGAIFRVKMHYVDLPLFTRQFLDAGVPMGNGEPTVRRRENHPQMPALGKKIGYSGQMTVASRRKVFLDPSFLDTPNYLSEFSPHA